MKKLTELRLSYDQITDSTLATLREAGLLHTLSRTSVPNNKRPRNAEEVTELDLSGTRVTDAGLKELAALKKLTELNLQRTPITDAGLKELAALQNLRKLQLWNTRITDAGLKELARLKSLAVLCVGGTKVTQRGIAELREALPHCEIIP
ncbi:MAG: hypothetical protein RMI91_15330 [Gemmatales bacterium]|nr:hypothetical protein [Gemmatales bacterium]